MNILVIMTTLVLNVVGEVYNPSIRRLILEDYEVKANVEYILSPQPDLSTE